MNEEEITAYHRQYGDDYGSETARKLKYQAILSLASFHGRTVLDAGCGEGKFRSWIPVCCPYTGIDLLQGTDLRDYSTQHQIVVANGVLYKLRDRGEAIRMIYRLWRLASEALIFTSLSSRAWEKTPGELYLDPGWTLGWCLGISPRVVLKHDYLPHDFTVALYRN